MLQVKNITFKYHKTAVVDAISFNVADGEHLSIIGESGSGKSTILKLIYGEHDLNEGEIFWNDNQILGPEFNLVVGYDFMKHVAQGFDLMPFITVEENIGKHLSNFFPEEKKARIAELLDVVELTDFAKVKVKTLSGGQKQRVALARAIANEPEILLLDEPFSHIDNFNKQSLRRNLFKYLKLKNITCIVATHDKEDVLGFSDRMMVLNNHKIAVHDTTQALYKDPKTPLIASFFDEFNMINSKIVYAHQLQVVEKSNIKAVVTQSYFKGNHYLIEATINGSNILFYHPTFIEINTGVHLAITTL
ncbi:ABC transporter ATP-binding protein [Lacinutrix undariae]